MDTTTPAQNVVDENQLAAQQGLLAAVGVYTKRQPDAYETAYRGSDTWSVPGGTSLTPVVIEGPTASAEFTITEADGVRRTFRVTVTFEEAAPAQAEEGPDERDAAPNPSPRLGRVQTWPDQAPK
jgi:hypothetical protein